MREVLELARRVRGAADGGQAELRQFLHTHTFPITDEGSATFFFWDGEPAEAVYLKHWVFGLESHQPFQRLGDTNAFYLPLELPNAARVEYKIEVVRSGKGHWMRDPLNPHRAFDPFGANSVCPMPGYHPPEWTVPSPEARKGHLEGLDIASKVFGDTRHVQVYLPPEHKPHKSYRLLVCHDGPDYLRYAGINSVLDNLIHRFEMSTVVVAFTSGVARNEEYGANPKQAEFLVRELLPTLHERYNLKTEPENRGLMGASFGAVSSLYTAWTHPGVFGKLLLQSGSFVFTDVGDHTRGPLFDPVVDFVNKLRGNMGPLAGTQMFMSCGTFESLIYYNRSLRPLLRDAGIDVRYTEAQDGHNWINWRDRLRDGLTWLFPGPLWMYYE